MLNILICCYNDSILDVPDILHEQHPDIRYVISHQYSHGYECCSSAERLHRVEDMRSRADVLFSQIEGKGLSINRNNCLEACIAVAGEDDICLIADDDVRYMPDSFDRVLRAFAQRPEADIIQFRITTGDPSLPFKHYENSPREIKHIEMRGHRFVSSVELAFRLAPVRAAGIRFNPTFGLGGTLYPQGGEEVIFLADCMRSGMRFFYVPEEIVLHPYESSGKAPKTVAKAKMYLAMAEYVYGRWSFESLIARLRCVYRRLLSLKGAK